MTIMSGAATRGLSRDHGRGTTRLALPPSIKQITYTARFAYGPNKQAVAYTCTTPGLAIGISNGACEGEAAEWESRECWVVVHPRSGVLLAPLCWGSPEIAGLFAEAIGAEVPVDYTAPITQVEHGMWRYRVAYQQCIERFGGRCHGGVSWLTSPAAREAAC